MMRIKYHYFIPIFIGIVLQTFIVSVSYASDENNYDEFEQTFIVPSSSGSLVYVLPSLESGESYMVKTLGATSVNEITLNSNELNENLISNNRSLGW